jgi:flavin reductase (DIM6/NTAB) family NADH-FMN oxidoreductase RutF
MHETIGEADFKSAMKHLAAGVTLITSISEGERCGMTATAVCSLSATPAQLIICVNRHNRTHRMILESRRFCVNLLAHDQIDVAQHFSSHQARAERFAHGPWSTLKTGAPALMNALTALDCELAQAIEVATHSIFIGRIVAVHAPGNRAPLLYHDGHYAGIAEYA